MAKKKNNKKINISLIILTILDILLLLLLVFNITRLDVLPIRYVIKCVIVVFLVHVIIYLMGLLKYKACKIISYILIVLTMLVYGAGIFYTGKTINFLRKTFNQANNSYTNSYLLLSINNYDEVHDFIDKDIAYYSKIPHIDKALEKLNSMIEYNKKSVDFINVLFSEDNVLIEKNIYETLKDTITEIDFGNYKIVYEFEITVDEEINNQKIKDVVTIYIGGFDFTDACNDFNMLVTINRNTHKILLTSIPRDYYFHFDEIESDELLDYTLKWGVNVPMDGLSKLFDIDIDYYMTIDTKSIVGLVDALPDHKATFCADFAFTTTHALVLDTYNDTKGKKLYVQKGCHEYTGIEILTIARERLAFSGGDRQRQKNCQQILINILNEMLSVDLLKNYTEFLEVLDNLYTTNIPDKLITSVAKDFIDGNKYEIEQQSADGYSSAGWMHLHTYYGGVMRPYKDSVEKVSNKIKEYYN